LATTSLKDRFKLVRFTGRTSTRGTDFLIATVSSPTVGAAREVVLVEDSSLDTSNTGTPEVLNGKTRNKNPKMKHYIAIKSL
jgi:hypothetical protein